MALGRLARAAEAVGVGAALVAGHMAYHRLARPRLLVWGATPAEAGERLPGDEQVPDPLVTTTRAVTVAAPAEAVWGFLLQARDALPLGCGQRWPAAADPGASLVLSPVDGRVSWSFRLRPEGQGTRLLSRVRMRMGWAPLMWLVASAIDLPWFLVERNVLRGIKDRAESEAGRPGAEVAG